MAEKEVGIALMNIEKFNLDEDDFGELTVWFRIVRNYCASGRHAQQIVARNSNILRVCKRVVCHLLSTKKHDLCLLIGLQFLANFLVDNRNHQNLVWEICSDQIKTAIRYNEPKIQNCAAMILYNLFLDNEHLLSSISDSLITVILELTQNEITAEYVVFILELFICKTHYIEEHYKDLSCNFRLIVLNVCESILKSSDRRAFPDGMILFFAQWFIERSHYMLRATTNPDSSEAVEIAMLLNFINSLAASQNCYLIEIQTSQQLLVHTISLLRTIHTISKERGNQFSMLLKLSDLEESSAELENDAAFGFKAALVRLVGNMCWRNRGHQDTARDMDAIPLILDTCNIDARNPLIIQWAVLAMRNLCEGNYENQRVVASIDNKGPMDTNRLVQLGLSMNGQPK